MSEIERILDQMDRAFSGNAWHGPPLKGVLEGLIAEDASNHGIADAHSIWELVLHITAWKIIVRHELTGEKVDVTPEIDWPPVWEASGREPGRKPQAIAGSCIRTTRGSIGRKAGRENR